MKIQFGKMIKYKAFNMVAKIFCTERISSQEYWNILFLRFLYEVHPISLVLNSASNELIGI